MGLTRSEQMSRIRGKDTSPERLLRSALWRAGLRFRLQSRTPYGRPDVVFSKARVAVFIDGCFWHGCPDHYVRPRTRNDFWSSKLLEN
ncbi:MAG TPA: very short patch repair endonuclease, partial [Archangium sp.]|nr:very short patch repair endonuclease [Archangium sp.]